MCVRRRAFTLVELLVVISIIALLMGLLLPSLKQARRQARCVTEMSATRQLLQAYITYASENNGALIAGHINDSPVVLDDHSKRLSPAEVVKRWPWRLRAYMGCEVFGSLLVNKQEHILSDRNEPMWSYMVSLAPSMGLNYLNLGGDQTGGGANNCPAMVGNIDRVATPSNMLTFTSARFGDMEGYFKIVPPTKAFEYSRDGWNEDDYRESDEPAAWGYVHPRWRNKAGVGFTDGHTETLSLEALRDMRRWCDAAQRASDPQWTAE